jgi:hypothetical protein
MTVNHKQADAFRRSNELAAEIILADVAKYGGEEALVVLWARRMLQRGDNLGAELKARAGLEPAGQTEREGSE